MVGKICEKGRQLTRGLVGDNLFIRARNNWKIYRMWEFKTYRKFADELCEVYEIVYILERCNPWPHVANRHISGQLLSL